MARRVTLVAGRGALVSHVADAIRRRGDTLQVVDLIGEREIAADELTRASLSDATPLLKAIKAFGPSHMVLAGGVHISDRDRRGLAQAFGAAGKLAGSLGDVGLAGMILIYCKAHGYKLVGVHEVAPELLAPEGLIAGPALGAELQSVGAYALKTARAVGAIPLPEGKGMRGINPRRRPRPVLRRLPPRRRRCRRPGLPSPTRSGPRRCGVRSASAYAFGVLLAASSRSLAS